MITRQEIIAVAAREHITPNGYDDRCENFEGAWGDTETNWDIVLQVSTCFDWLANVHRTQRVTTYMGSYGLKHVVQRVTGQYVCNGAFLIACHIAGMQVKRFRGPNACINISKRDCRPLSN